MNDLRSTFASDARGRRERVRAGPRHGGERRDARAARRDAARWRDRWHRRQLAADSLDYATAAADADGHVRRWLEMPFSEVVVHDSRVAERPACAPWPWATRM